MEETNSMESVPIADTKYLLKANGHLIDLLTHFAVKKEYVHD